MSAASSANTNQYLGLLTRRMQQLGFTDEVYEAAKKALDATHTLSVKLHYASCDFIGKPLRTQ